MSEENKHTTTESEAVALHPPCSVFEAVDATSDEQYFTVGIWPTLKGALDVMEECGDEPPGEDMDDESRIIEVRERKLGVIDWSGTGKLVATLEWVKSYAEDSFNEWRRVKTPNADISDRAGDGGRA